MQRPVTTLLPALLLPSMSAALAEPDRSTSASPATDSAPYAADAAPPATGHAPPAPPRTFAGGGLGLSFGDIDYVSLYPFFGVLRFEYYDAFGAKVSDDYSSVFVGGGLSRPMGGATAFVVSGMYNLSWSDDEPSPYDSPWVITAGVSVGF